MRKVLFAINPAATSHVGRLAARCAEQARAHGWSPEVLGPDPRGGTPKLVRGLTTFVAEAAEDSERMVVAVGGDGTARTCAAVVGGTLACLAIVPRGAANLFARALGVPATLDGALAVAFGGQQVDIDLCWAGEEPFTAMAGLGIDASVVAATPKWFKDHLGWAGYAVSALPQLSHKPQPFKLTLDEEEPLTLVAQCVVVANVGILPGGFGIFPGARMDDGLLEVGVLFPKSVLGWALMARSVLSRGHFGDRYFAHYRATTVEVSAERSVARQVDGDAVGPGRAWKFRSQHRVLKVRAPWVFASAEPPGKVPE